jgi:hypothetical protein
LHHGAGKLRRAGWRGGGDPTNLLRVKHAVLASIAHNVADSFASGVGLLIGYCEMDVFGEAERSAEGYMVVNFLTGRTSGATPSESLSHAVRLYAEALPDLCERHGAHVSDFQALTARYGSQGLQHELIVTTKDRRGRETHSRYVGVPGKRPRFLDPLGRIRRIRSA